MTEGPPDPQQDSSARAKRQHLLDIIDRAADSGVTDQQLVNVTLLAALCGVWYELERIADTLQSFAQPPADASDVVLDEGGQLHEVVFSEGGNPCTKNVRASGLSQIRAWCVQHDYRLLEVRVHD